MAAADSANVNNSDWKKKESLGSALLQVGVVAVLLAGTVFWVYQRGSQKKETAEGLKTAREMAMKGNPADLTKALAQVNEVLESNASSGDALALAAGLYTEQWLLHGVAGAEAKAREYTERADQTDSRSEERYGSKALILVADGKAKEADTFIDELRKQGASSGRLWQALGKAQQSLGNLQLARQAFSSAVEKSWKDPRYASSYGEALMAEGQLFQALDALTKGMNVSPDHFRTRLLAAWVRVQKADRVKDASDTVTEILQREAELSVGLKALALSVKAELANFSNQYDEAMKLADEALALDSGQVWALVARARALALKKDAGAVEAFRAAAARGKTLPVIYFDGANLLQAMGNHDAAMALLQDYENVFQGVPAMTSDGQPTTALARDDRYWLTRGDVLKAASKFPEAMASYEKAIAASSSNLIKANYAKAALLIEQGEYDKATEVLTDITPQDGTGVLAEAYIAMGDALFAKKDYAPGCQNYAFALTRFKALQAPREKLNALLTDVEKKLIAANQRAVAAAWVKEAKPLIQ